MFKENRKGNEEGSPTEGPATEDSLSPSPYSSFFPAITALLKRKQSQAAKDDLVDS